RRGARMAGPPRTPFAEQREGIVSCPVGIAKAPCRTASAFAADRTHFPGRPMPGQSLLLVLRNRIFAHAGEEIVCIIKSPHMFEAELPVFAGTQAAFRRAVRCRRRAAGPLAVGKLGGVTAVMLRLDPNPIEQRRIGSHGEIMRACRG